MKRTRTAAVLAVTILAAPLAGCVTPSAVASANGTAAMPFEPTDDASYLAFPRNMSEFPALTVDIARFDPDAPYQRPWLLQTARNLIGDAYRRRDRERGGLRDLAATARPNDDLAPVELRHALSLLRRADREVIELHYWDGLATEEFAEVVGCRTATAWKRLSQARRPSTASPGARGGSPAGSGSRSRQKTIRTNARERGDDLCR